jgi:hypothetical protein
VLDETRERREALSARQAKVDEALARLEAMGEAGRT